MIENFSQRASGDLTTNAKDTYMRQRKLLTLNRGALLLSDMLPPCVIAVVVAMLVEIVALLGNWTGKQAVVAAYVL